MEDSSVGATKDRSVIACLACRESKVREADPRQSPSLVCPARLVLILIQKRCSGVIDSHDSAVCSRCQLLGLECRFRARAKRGTAEQRKKRKLPHGGVDTAYRSSPSVSSTPAPASVPYYEAPISSSRLQRVMNDRQELLTLVRRYFETVHCGSCSDSAHMSLGWLT